MEKLQEKKIRWIPIAIMTIIFSIVGAITFLLLSPAVSGSFQCMYNFGIMSQTTMFAVCSFLFLMMVYPLRYRFNMSPTFLTCLYISGLVVSWTLARNEGPMFPASWAQFVLYEGSMTPPITEWWWVPPKVDVMNMRIGGMSINWAVWIPSIFFWSWAFYANFILGLGLSSIFRQRWIDIERHPFPMTLSAHEILRRIPYTKENRYMKPFTLGVILGFVFQFPIFMAQLFPWFPDIYGWRTDTCPLGIHQIKPGNPIGDNIVGFFLVSKDPVAFGAFFLSPLSVSFSVMIFTLTMIVLEQIAYTMGYYTGILQCGGCTRVWSGSNNLWHGPPFYWAWVFGIGGIFALTTMIFYHSRGYLKETLMATLKRPSQLSETQKNEAMSYRSAYIAVIIGIAAILGFMLSAGIDLLTAFVVFFITIFINQMANLYVYAHTGLSIVQGCGGNWGSWAMVMRFPEGRGSPPYSQGFVMSNWLTENWTDVPSNGAGNGLFTTMMAFKMASLTGMGNRDVLRVTVFCWILAIPTVFITRTWISNVYGARILTGMYAAGCDLSEHFCFSAAFSPSYPRPYTLAVYGAFGFIIVTVLSLLRARFIWWPLDPMGFVISTSLTGADGLWFPFMVAWIAKTIVLRTGGSKLYENYGVPVIGGFMGGVVVANIIGVVAGTFRFFYPY